MREFIQIFRDGGFESLSVAAQTEILKDRIRRIVVREDGVYQVEIYAEKPGNGLNGSFGGASGFGGKKGASGENSARSTRSGVRTVFKVVHPSGLEPETL